MRIRLTKLHRESAEGAGRESLPKQVYFWPSAAAVRSARRPKALGLAVTRDPGARHRWVSPRVWGPGARSSRGRAGELAGAAVTPSTQHESLRLDPVPHPSPAEVQKRRAPSPPPWAPIVLAIRNRPPSASRARSCVDLLPRDWTAKGSWRQVLVPRPRPTPPLPQPFRP